MGEVWSATTADGSTAVKLNGQCFFEAPEDNKFSSLIVAGEPFQTTSLYLLFLNINPRNKFISPSFLMVEGLKIILSFICLLFKLYKK